VTNSRPGRVRFLARRIRRNWIMRRLHHEPVGCKQRRKDREGKERLDRWTDREQIFSAEYYRGRKLRYVSTFPSRYETFCKN